MPEGHGEKSPDFPPGCSVSEGGQDAGVYVRSSDELEKGTLLSRWGDPPRGLVGSDRVRPEFLRAQWGSAVREEEAQGPGTGAGSHSE